MPKFFQHVGPRVYKVFSFPSRNASDSVGDQRGRNKPSAACALANVKDTFAKYKPGLSDFESDNDSCAQVHNECNKPNELEASHLEAKWACLSTQTTSVGFATKRDDLEYGHQGS